MSRQLRLFPRFVVFAGLACAAFWVRATAQTATNLTINNATLIAVGGDGFSTAFNPTGAGAVLPWSSIFTGLSSGGTTITTVGSFNNSQVGDITIAASPSGLNSANLLTFSTAAAGGIFINAAISNSGAGALTFNAGSGGISLGADVTTVGAQTYSTTGTTTLGAATVALSTTNSGITLGAIAGAAKNLTLNPGSGNVTGSSISNLGTLTLTGSGTSQFTGNVGAATVDLSGKTGGGISFQGNLTATAFTTTGAAYSVTFNGASSSITNDTNFLNTGSVTLGNGGDIVVFVGGLATTGNATNPSSTNIGGSVRAHGQQIDLGTVNLTSVSDIDSTNNGSVAAGANINLGTINGGSANDLTVRSGNVGVVSGTSVGGVGKLTLFGNGVTFTGNVSGNTLELKNTGNATFGSSVSMTTVDLTTKSAGNVAFNGGLNATTLSTGSSAVNLSQNGGTITNALSYFNTGTLGLNNVSFTNGAVATAPSAVTVTGAVQAASNGFTFGDSDTPVSLGGSVTSPGSQFYGGAVSLLGGTSLSTTTSGSAIQFGSTLNGAQSLTLSLLAGNVTFTGVVGGTTPLMSLSSSVGSTVNLNGGGVTTTGSQSYGALSLGANTALTTTNSNMSFGTVTGNAKNLILSPGSGSINGSSMSGVATLGLNGSGTITFSGNVSATSVDVTGKTAGSVSFSGGLSATSLTTGTGAYSLTLSGGPTTVANATTFGNTGILTFGNGNVATFTGGLTATAPSFVNLGGTLRTAAQPVVLGSVSLTNVSTIDTTNNNASPAGASITLGSVSATNAGLTLNSGTSGVTTLGGAVVASSLTTDSGGTTAINGGAVTTLFGGQTYNDPVALGANTVLAASGGSINLSAGVTGNSHSLTLSPSGNATLGASTGLTTLNKLGFGQLTLAGAIDYSSSFAIAEGSVTTNVNGALKSTSSVAIVPTSANTFTSLNIGGTSQTVSSLVLGGLGSAQIKMGTGSLTLGTLANGSTVTFAGSGLGAIISGGALNLPGATAFAIGDSATADFDLTIFSTIGGGSALTLSGGGALLLAGSGNAIGGIDVQAGALFVGASNALGSSATSTIASGATIAAHVTNGSDTITLANPMTLQSGAYLGSPVGDGTLVFGGQVTVGGTNPTLHLLGDSPTVFFGGLTGSGILNFVGDGFAIMGSPVTGFTQLVANNSGLVFGASTALGGSYTVQSSNGGYVGVFASTQATPPSAATLIGRITSKSTFNGTFGFDTGDEGAHGAHVFTEDLDFSQFTGNFTVGSHSAAVLTGKIKPVEYTGEGHYFEYVFGNGGGVLAVQSNLGGTNTGLSLISPLSQPLTLILRGKNTFDGGLYVYNSALVLDSPRALPFILNVSNQPTYNSVYLDGVSYFGATEAFASATSFLTTFGQVTQGSSNTATASQRIFGLDSHLALDARLSGHENTEAFARVVSSGLDMGQLSYGTYLGTRSNLKITGTLSGNDGLLALTGVQGGKLTVASALSTGTLRIGLPGVNVEGNGVVELTNAGNSVSNTQLLGGTLLVGASGALGNGSLSVIGSGGSTPTLASTSASGVTLPNAISLSSDLQLGRSEFEDHADFLQANRTTLTLNGNISGGYALNVRNGRTILGGSNNYASVFVQNGALIFGSSSAVASGSSLVSTGSGYIGYTNSADFQSNFLARFNSATTGSLGFDTLTGSPTTFSADVDLQGFTLTGGSIRLGTATSAIISGNILPPSNTAYRFGGGGGKLEVSSALVNNGSAGRSVVVDSSGGLPSLTLLLSGANTYTGGTTVNQSAVIFTPTAIPSSGNISTGQGGYAGVQLPAADASADATNLASLLSHFQNNGQAGFVGLDSSTTANRTVTTAINLGSYSGAYLSTTSNLTVSGALTFAGGNYRFAGYNGGNLTVASALTGSGSVRVGESNTPATQSSMAAGTAPVISTVTLANGGNTYSGGTNFYTGSLVLGTSSTGVAGSVTQGPLGTGSLTVLGVNFERADHPLLTAASGVSIANAINLNSDLDVGGSTSFTLTGPITSFVNSFGEFAEFTKVGSGTLTLSGTNSFGGGIYIQEGSVNFATAAAVGGGPLEFGFSPSSPSAIFSASSTVNGIFGDSSTDKIYLGSSVALTINQTFDSVYLGSFGSLGAGTSILFTGPNAATPARLRLTGDSSGIGGFTGTSTIGSGITVIAAHAGANSAFGPGAITLNGGKLAVDAGTTLSNALTLTAGTLGGNGTFKPGAGLTIGSNVVLAPGFGGTGTTTFDGTGIASGATLTLASGGQYYWQIADATNPNGGWDQVSVVNGSVNITATSGARFEFKLVTVASDGAPSLASNFLGTQPYHWTVLTASSPILVGGATADPNTLSSLFTVTTSGSFLNSTFGGSGLGIFSFSLAGGGTQLQLDFTPVPEPSTYVLMASGLGAMALVLRRRKNARR